MNTYWSDYIQSSEELYQSRALRFRKDNMHRWAEAMGLQNGMNVLEVGCAGGLLCHRMKEQFPECQVTGLDFDLGHIAYAQQKTKELGLDCTFVAGDATKLPFQDETFDLCCSHTVMSFCEPAAFVSEQHRVLKVGGRMVIMGVYRPVNPEEWVPTEDCAELPLFDKVWEAASQNRAGDIIRYENDPRRYFDYLERRGFRDLSIDAMAAVNYAPDCDNVSRELSLMQINEDRLSELESAAKAVRLAPHALTEAEQQELFRLINARWDKRIAQREAGEKTWDFRINTVWIISGTKN